MLNVMMNIYFYLEIVHNSCVVILIIIMKNIITVVYYYLFVLCQRFSAKAGSSIP